MGQNYKQSATKNGSYAEKIFQIINFECLKDRVKMSELYNASHILQLNDIFKLEMGKFVHSFYHKNLSENFKNYFSSTSIHHAVTLQDL